MYEMTAAELDAELAIELPDRALMKKVKLNHNVWIQAHQSNKSTITQQANGGKDATANANGGNANANANNNGNANGNGSQAQGGQAQGGQGGNGGGAFAGNGGQNEANVWQANVIAVVNN